jgi:hypothetical protein
MVKLKTNASGIFVVVPVDPPVTAPIVYLSITPDPNTSWPSYHAAN